MNDYPELIDDDSSLKNHCEQWQRCDWLAVDTEFERESTYYPELCLIQVAGEGRVGLIDAMAITDLGPLYKLLNDPSITKVFHSARQDFEIFYHLQGKLPAPLFDTQIAAALRGHDDQTGYATLVRDVLDVDLAKSQTRTNWKRRPLSPEQLRYAAEDVIYLGQLYQLLLEKLMESGQLQQFQQQCQALNRPELYEPDPDSMWQKIRSRAIKNFSNPSLAVLKRLAAWRELTARRKNRPRKWIIKDNALIAVARELPVNLNALSRLDGIDERIMKRYGSELLRIATLESGR